MLHETVTPYGLEEIHCVKQEQFLICHLFGMAPAFERLNHLVSDVAAKVQTLSPEFFLVLGKKVGSASRLYESYNSTVIKLQSCFYYPYGSCFLTDGSEVDFTSINDFPVSIDHFRELLHQKDPKIENFSSDIYETLKASKSTMPNQVKNLYYQMFCAVQESYHLLQLPLPEKMLSSADAFELIFHCKTLLELHTMLTEELKVFLKQVNLSSRESASITAIKNFIASNYQDENLSIKDISEHVFLSTSYICTIFKTETGQTLNQYITKYRMEKAKKLLADPLIKISDISARVGYNDGNYFGKTFKKIVGLSPTEYREQVTGL